MDGVVPPSISAKPVPFTAPGFEDGPGEAWSEQIKRELRQSKPRKDGSITCGGCRKRFNCGWAWLSHFERAYGRLRCGANNLLAVWGFSRDEWGVWSRRVLTTGVTGQLTSRSPNRSVA